MPGGLNQHGFEACSGKLYVVAGEGPNAGDHSAKTYEYDPATDAWTTKLDLPIAVQSGILRAVGTKLYYIGGYTSATHTYYPDTYEFDPGANTWTKKTDAPTAREDMGSAVIDGKIYVFGGIATAGITKALEIYDPATDTWDTGADMPDYKLLGDFGCAHDGKIYAFDANSTMADYPTFHVTGAVYVYDPDTDTWETKATAMPLPRCYKEAVSIGSNIYIGPGAITNTTTYTNTIYRYNPANDTWTEMPPSPYGARGVGLCVLNGAVYMSGGYNANGMLASLYRMDYLT